MSNLVEKIVKADGNAFIGGGVTPRAGRCASKFIEDALRHSVQMRAQARSRKVGHPTSEIRALWTVYEKGRSGQSWVYAAPMIKDAAPSLLEQPSLFGNQFNPFDTAFELFQDAMNAVCAQEEDSLRFDSDLLTDFSMKSLLHAGISTIQLAGVERARLHPADEVLRDRAFALLAKTPNPKRVRLVGTLDMVKSSNLNFEFVQSDGPVLRGIWMATDPDILGRLWSRRVTLDAILVFKPNGKPLRLEGLAVREPEERDEPFAQIQIGNDTNARLVPNKNTLRIGELVGSWSGPETDEEVAEALALLRS